MLIDKKIQNVLDALRNDLQFDADVTDLDGKVIASTLKARIGQRNENLLKQPNGLFSNVITHDSSSYAVVNSESRIQFYVVLEGSNKAVRDYALLIAKLIEVNLSFSNKKLSREDCLRKILTGETLGYDIEEAVSEHKIAPDLQRCVFVIRTPKMQGDKVYDLIIKAFSKNRFDFLIHMNTRTLVLIKTITDDIENEDFAQLAAAIFESVFSETSIKIVIGAGRTKPYITLLRESYIEAQKAIEAGLIFNPTDCVHLYGDLWLERFVNQIPVDISDIFLSDILTEEFDKLFTTEMMATVKVLFDNSLNLSEAARRLYIHRNTLVYRIDKIEKTTGLDLRNFHDSVTFRIMMMLKARR